jgi:aryl-alcohol dehydrogenase-like predicted oxidoreductase
VIATKFGVRLDAQGRRQNDSSPRWCREAVRGSLQRLGVDCIDVYQMHCHDGVTPLADTIGELENLRASGLIREWGLCNLTPADVPPDAWASCASLQAELSLLSISKEPAALEACTRGVRFLAYGVLAQGLLAGRYDAETRFPLEDRRSQARYRNFHGNRFHAALQVVGELKACASELGCRPGVLAIAWVRSLHPRIWPIVGIKTRSHLDDAVAAAELLVPDAVDARLRTAAARFAEAA